MAEADDDSLADDDPLTPRSLPLDQLIPPVRWPLALLAAVGCGVGAAWEWAARGPSLIAVAAAVAGVAWVLFAGVRFALGRGRNAEPDSGPDRRGQR
jgi:hypothetical protein